MSHKQTTRDILQFLLYYQKFCANPLTPPLNIIQCGKVIFIALNLCANTNDPTNLSDKTVIDVLTKAGFTPVMPVKKEMISTTVIT